MLAHPHIFCIEAKKRKSQILMQDGGKLLSMLCAGSKSRSVVTDPGRVDVQVQVGKRKAFGVSPDTL